MQDCKLKRPTTHITNDVSKKWKNSLFLSIIIISSSTLRIIIFYSRLIYNIIASFFCAFFASPKRHEWVGRRIMKNETRIFSCLVAAERQG